MKELTTDAEIRDVLTRARTIAVLGAHPDASRPAHYVPRYLQGHGYRVLPVNAVQAGQQILGETVRARLDELDESVDIVDIFRRADALEGHLAERTALAGQGSARGNEGAQVLEDEIGGARLERTRARALH